MINLEMLEMMYDIYTLQPQTKKDSEKSIPVIAKSVIKSEKKSGYNKIKSNKIHTLVHSKKED